MKKYSKSVLLGLFVVLISIGCANTKIIGSWKNADSTKRYSKIMIVGLSANVVAKTNVEAQMAKVLDAQGIKAVGAGNVFNPDMKITDEMKQEVAVKLKSEGYDGVLTIALISVDNQTSYVPGAIYAPYGYPGYSNYWGYYGYYAPQVYSPGYYVKSKVYNVEANLYDVDSGKLMWSARSESTDPGSLDRFSKEYSKTVVYQLMKDKMLDNND